MDIGLLFTSRCIWKQEDRDICFDIDNISDVLEEHAVGGNFHEGHREIVLQLLLLQGVQHAVLVVAQLDFDILRGG